MKTNINTLPQASNDDQSKALAREMLAHINGEAEREYGLNADQLLAEKHIGKEKAIVETRVARTMEKMQPSAHDKLTAFFKPYKDSLRATGNEPNSFADMTETTYGLGNVTKFLGVQKMPEATNDGERRLTA